MSGGSNNTDTIKFHYKVSIKMDTPGMVLKPILPLIKYFLGLAFLKQTGTSAGPSGNAGGGKLNEEGGAEPQQLF